MILALNCVAILVISLWSGSGQREAAALEELVSLPEAREMVLMADGPGLQKLLAKLLLGRDLEQIDTDSAAIGLLSRLVPGFSALVIADELLSYSDPGKRRVAAEKTVSQGLYRRLGITKEVAPNLLRLSLMEELGTSPLRNERDRLLVENEQLLEKLLAWKKGQKESKPFHRFAH